MLPWFNKPLVSLPTNEVMALNEDNFKIYLVVAKLHNKAA